MDYRNYNDYELIYMIRENDDDSSNILLEKYRPIIISLVNKHYQKNINNSYDFEDYYQEAILAFYKAIDDYDSTKEVLFYTFVSVCIERSLISFSRRISSTKENIYNNYIPIDYISYLIEDKEKNIEDINRFKEIEEIYKDIIYNSTLEIGSILELKYNGFGYREISNLLDIPISSIEFKIRKVKRILKFKLTQYNCK